MRDSLDSGDIGYDIDLAQLCYQQLPSQVSQDITWLVVCWGPDLPLPSWLTDETYVTIQELIVTASSSRQRLAAMSEFGIDTDEDTNWAAGYVDERGNLHIIGPDPDLVEYLRQQLPAAMRQF